ncbi:hypothetical protein [Enterobacter roggenkampii]|uniref:hypothetical protein n=1 Tax=Enterobacter roggenkampii TaxID=1812935 RepID=UPI001C7004A4|nr:hypothetical protein [Enterobacter roggenkampii]MBW9442015.1 hypothetical protein [Enterobacter roggenkampii]
MMSLWDALRMNMMISYQELVRTFPKAIAPGNIAYVVVEPAQAGAKSIVVADPHHVILSRAGVEFGNMDESMAVMALADKGFTFSDYAEVALRTT